VLALIVAAARQAKHLDQVKLERWLVLVLVNGGGELELQIEGSSALRNAVVTKAVHSMVGN
jgi:hypothetical protein